ncbi:MAG: Gfo/Idh/MocA family oxidoreductase, partial [Candidatus Hydrogenedentes bacterium]|nr:Gfo/Idh/MocA family oxidoreductase [Candidatus Hydrogenedentota bacterium]
MTQPKVSRRTFLMGSAAATAGIASDTRPRRAGARVASPNGKLNVAAIGSGGKGRTDIQGCKSENIVALCDVDWVRAARAFSQYPKATRYKDFREMLEKEQIDAVTVSTPDHTHAVAAMAAMSIGIHVYVQKPLTYTIAEARLLAASARKFGVKTQMGNQAHCHEGVRKLCELIWNGDIGQVHEAHIWTNRPKWPQGIDRPKETPPIPRNLDWNLWLSAAPDRPYNPAYLPSDWRGWLDFGCGALGDMACHIADPANWALRLHETGPISAEALLNEGMTSETFPRRTRIRFDFPARGDMDPVAVYWYDGGARPSIIDGIPEGVRLGDGKNGSVFIGTKGIATAGEYGGRPRLLAGDRVVGYKFPDETVARIPD